MSSGISSIGWGQTIVGGSAGAVPDPSVVLHNSEGAILPVGTVVRSNGTTGQVVKAFGDTQAHCDGAFGVVLNAIGIGADGLVETAGTPVVQFDGVPVVNAIAYVSVTTSGQATTTVPPVAGTNSKLRLGVVVSVSGTTGKVAWHPEKLSVAADGLL